MSHHPSLSKLEKRIGHVFTDRTLLKTAVTHTSYAGEAKNDVQDYERLEFLGDRVLDLVIAHWLYERFSEESEGDLAKRHTALVQEMALTKIAGELGVGEFLFLSVGEDNSGGREKSAILSDVVEAVIGAIYLDSGLDQAQGFIRRFWANMIDQNMAPPVDPKTELQEWTQQNKQSLPVYALVGTDGPAHDQVFEIELRIDGLDPVRSKAGSKRKAQKQAARKMLAQIKGITS